MRPQIISRYVEWYDLSQEICLKNIYRNHPLEVNLLTRKVCQVLFIPVEPHNQVYIPVQKSINAICGDWNPFILVLLYATTPLIHYWYQLLHRSSTVHELTSKERNFFMGPKISNSFRTYSRCSITVNIRNIKGHMRTLVPEAGISGRDK